QAARIAPGIRDLHQLEIACDVLVVDDLAVILLQQGERHMRLKAFDFVAHWLEFVRHAERVNLMSGRAQGAHDVVFCFPLMNLLRGVPAGRVWRHKLGMHEYQDAQAPHNAIHLRRDGPNSACMVLAVSRTVKSVRSFRSEPTARRLCARQRVIMSSSTASSVSLTWARWRLIKTE